ncbi:MAG: MFS transporter [Myxococcota bacterium]
MSEALAVDEITPPPRLPRSLLLTYAAPSVGTHFTFMLMGLYFVKFGVDVLRLEPAVIGGLMLVSRLWDAFSDPIAGYLSDRTRTRFGRRRPWIAGAALPFGISVVMLWSPPASLSETALTAWIGIGLIVLYTAYTGLMVPYGALGAELSQDYHDRTRLFAYRQGVGAAGLILGAVAFYLMLEAEDPATAPWGLESRALGSAIAVVSLVLVCGFALVLVLRLRERPDYQDRGPMRVFGAFADVWRNPHARPLLAIQGLHFFSMIVLTMTAGFMFDHVMDETSANVFVLVFCYVAGTFCTIPLWVRFSERYGKNRVWSVSLLAIGFVYLLMFAGLRDGLPTGLFPLIVSGLAAGFLGGAGSGNFVLSHSMQADVIDYDEHTTGERKEGAYLATWSFVEKCAGALAAGVIGLALQWVGYERGAEEQSATTRLTILALMSLLPAACHFAGALLLRGFALNQTEHARIRTELDARRRAERP